MTLRGYGLPLIPAARATSRNAAHVPATRAKRSLAAASRPRASRK